ncbi:MAG: tryptophan synthase subunit alpha [Bacteroidales bacterium]|nr:tryptophan synthase subunit alpha [Bacteroidales bacterium]
MNRIDQLFREKTGEILSVYFTAGYPELDDTSTIIREIEKSGGDLVEVGMPFSDPLADGPVLQESNKIALENGMSLKKLFDQLNGIRDKVTMPIILMGYLNPVLQYGLEKFCKDCTRTGIDGVILPDLPLDVYIESFQGVFEKYGIHVVFLVTPQTSVERIRAIESASKGFLYLVTASSTTGIRGGISEEQIEYFKRIKGLNLRLPCLAGFGISSHETFKTVCRHTHGAIIGSAFVKHLGKGGDLKQNIRSFIEGIKTPLRKNSLFFYTPFWLGGFFYSL